MFLHSPTVDGSREALLDPGTGRWWTHAELREAATSLAGRLAPARGGLAFLLARNVVGAAIGYLACVEASLAVLLLDGRMPRAALERLLGIYEPEVVLTVDDARPDATYEPTPGGQGVGLWWRSSATRHPPVHPELAVLLSTSGSTGSPKLVRLTRRAVEANAGSIATALDIDPGHRGMACLPLHYSYGLSVLNSHLLAGASVVLTDDTVASPHFWRLLRAQGCTSMPGVPYTYDLLTRIGFERLDAPSIRMLTQAGGRLPVERVLHFHSVMAGRGGELRVMYGQTEATARIACMPRGRLPGAAGSVGIAVPGGRISIDSGDGLEAQGGEPGEIVYTGPNVMMGYAESRPDLSRGDDLHGRLRTGDLGFLDGEGLLHVTGRIKRIGKVLGMRVNLDEVESRLRSHGPTAVVAGDDGLIIYCEYGDERLFGSLADELARDMRATPASFAFRRIPALPRTAAGKPDYGRLAPR